MLAPRRFWIPWLWSATVALLCLAQGPPEIPKAREAAVLARVLSYELTLQERAGEAVGIAVVYMPGNTISEANAEQWYQALSSLGSVRIKGKRLFALKVPHDPSALALAIDRGGVDVLLISKGFGSELDDVANVARSKHVLSAADTVEYLNRSSTACVTQEGEKPKIYINLNNAELEHIRFSSHLLRLTTLVR